MDRRNFILGGAAGICGLAGPANAEWRCSPYNYQGVQYCEAGVRINRLFTAKQECQNWCWAACIQSTFRQHGKRVSQQEIVSRVYADTGCRTANGPQIVQAISGRWRDQNGSEFDAIGEPIVDLQYGIWNPAAAVVVAQELSQGYPLINGALGHATMISAIGYYRDIYSRWQVQSLTVRDPWPGNRNKRFLSPQEAMGTFFIARIRVI